MFEQQNPCLVIQNLSYEIDFETNSTVGYPKIMMKEI